MVSSPFSTTRSLAVLKPVIWVSLALQGAVYGALAPQLVTLQNDVGFSDSFAGILTGAYTAGMLPGVVSILILGTRVSARSLYLWGLLIIGVSSVYFGSARDFELLAVARAAQGFGGGVCFAGGTAWLTGAGRASERGAMLGLAWGGMTIGTVVGPVVGAVAAESGPDSLYAGIGLAFFLIGGVALTVQLKPRGMPRDGGDAAIQVEQGKLWVPLGLLVSPALVIGVLNVLVPLMASHHDGTSLVTTAAFLGAAVIGGLSSPLVGRISDRYGPSRVIRIGMVVSAITALGLAVTTNLVLLAVLTVAYLGIANVLSSVPAVAAASSIGSRGGLASVGAAIAIIFAVFETAGAFIAVPSRELFGGVLPFVGLGVVASLSLVLVSRLRVVQPTGSTESSAPVLQSPKP